MKNEYEVSFEANLSAQLPNWTAQQPTTNSGWLPAAADDRLGAAIWDGYVFKKLQRVTWKYGRFRRTTLIGAVAAAHTLPTAPGASTTTLIQYGPARPWKLYYDRGQDWIGGGTVTPSPNSLEDWSNKLIRREEDHIFGSINVRQDVCQHITKNYADTVTAYPSWTNWAIDTNVNGRYLLTDPSGTAANTNCRLLGVTCFPQTPLGMEFFQTGTATLADITARDSFAMTVSVYTTWKLSKKIR